MRIFKLTAYIFLISLTLISEGYSFRSYFKLRAFGSIGYTTGGNVNIGTGSLLNYRFSAQPVYQVSRYIGFGFDVGYLHAFSVSYDAASSTNGRSPYRRVDYLHTLGLLDFSFLKNLVVIQFAVGPYFGIADNSDEIAMGFMIAPGLDIPVTKSISIPIFTRFEFIFGEKSIFPANVSVGVTIKFK